MATSGSVTVKVTGYNNLVFEWNMTSQSVANNTSTVSWAMKLVAIGASGKITSNSKKNWNVTVNGTDYSGTNTIGISGKSTKTLASGSTVISHNVDGTKTFTFSFKQQFSGLVFAGVAISDKSGSGLGTLPDIPRKATITNAPNFNDEGNPTITYSNPAGNAVSTLQACISLTGSTDNIAYRDISKSGTSYTFNLTSAERSTLRNATTTSNSRSVKFYVKTVIGSNTFYNSVERTLTIINANPTLTPTVSDGNAKTVALTGDANKFVRYYSTGSYSISKSAKKGATIKSVVAKCGSQSKSSATLVSGSFAKVDSGIFDFSVTDSRGNTVSKTLTKTLINYVPLTANVEGSIALSETDSTKAKILFTVSGNYFNGSFGATSNSLTLKYTLKSGGNTIKTETLTIPTSAYSGTTYKLIYTIPEALDYKNSYTVTIQAVDKLASISKTSKSLKAVPIFEWGEKDFKVNGEFYVENEWHNLTIASGFALYGGNAAAQPKYKVCGSVVTVTGCLTPTAAFTSANTNKSICSTTIPEQFRPQYAQYAICQGSMLNRWLVRVGADGTITMSRYGITENVQVNPGDWLPFTITYQY